MVIASAVGGSLFLLLLVVIIFVCRRQHHRAKKDFLFRPDPFNVNVVASPTSLAFPVGDCDPEKASLEAPKSITSTFIRALPALNAGGWMSRLRRGRPKKLTHSPSSSVELEDYHSMVKFRTSEESFPYSTLANPPLSPIESPLNIAVYRPTGKADLQRASPRHGHTRSLSSDNGSTNSTVVFNNPYASPTYFQDSPVDFFVCPPSGDPAGARASQHLSSTLLASPPPRSVSLAAPTGLHGKPAETSPLSPRRRLPTPIADPLAAFAAVRAHVEAGATSPSSSRRTRPLPVPKAIRVGIPLPRGAGRTPPSSSSQPPPYQLVYA